MVQSTTSLSSSIFWSDGNTRLLLFARTPPTLARVSYTRLHFFFSSALLNLSAMRIHFATYSFDFQRTYILFLSHTHRDIRIFFFYQFSTRILSCVHLKILISITRSLMKGNIFFVTCRARLVFFFIFFGIICLSAFHSIVPN